MFILNFDLKQGKGGGNAMEIEKATAVRVTYHSATYLLTTLEA